MGIENILQKGVKVQLDKERVLKYPFGALAYLAEQYGSVTAALNKFGDFETSGKTGDWLTKDRLYVLVDFILAGLLADDPNLDRRAVANMIDLENLLELIPAVGMAIQQYFPKPKESVENPR